VRILHVSNLACHLQLPLAKQILEVVGVENFRFAATAQPDPERIKLGWNLSFNEPWILRAGESVNDKIEFEKWWEVADIVICGDRRFDRMQDRIKSKKLCFYMSERWWKPPIGRGRLLWPSFFNLACKFRALAKSEYFHYLPIGVYSAHDIMTLSTPNQRIWKWGYFTQSIYDFNSVEALDVPKQNNILKILWVGRMLNWKRVDTLIKAVSLAIKAGTSLVLTLVGVGPEKERLRHLASRILPNSTCIFLDAMPANEIPNLMKKNDVYVLPSNAYEGWGAVLNEAMGCKCTVVASRQTGAAASMITHGKNGMLFDTGNCDALSELLITLYKNPSLRAELAQAGCNTVQQLWSPKVAASRLIEFSDALVAGGDIKEFNAGPLSSALCWPLPDR